MSVSTHSGPLPREALDDVLTGRLGVEPVRRVVLEPWLFGMLELLERCIPDGHPRSLSLLRSKYKPSRKLTGYYVMATGNGNGSRHVAVSWSTPEDRSEESTSILTARSSDGRARAWVSPADPALPQLERLVRPDHLAGLFRGMGRIGVTSDAQVRTVRYRPGERHVLQVVPAPRRRGVFVKVDRDDSGSRAVPIAKVFGPELRRRCPGAALAAPAGYDRVDHAAVWWQADGHAMSRCLAGSPVEAGRLVALVGAAVRVLHDNPLGLTPSARITRAHPLGSHDVSTEGRATLRAGEHIRLLLPDTGEIYVAVASAVLSRLAALPHEPPTSTHGDLKCDNILVDQGEIRILDLDRFGWADPALDLGKLLADLRWWAPSEGRFLALADHLRRGYGRCDQSRWERAELLSTLFALKLAARRCAVHDPRWESQVRAHVHRAASVLDMGREVS